MTVNITPWEIRVYAAAWQRGQKIDELCQAFESEREACRFAYAIGYDHPEYWIELYHNDKFERII